MALLPSSKTEDIIEIDGFSNLHLGPILLPKPRGNQRSRLFANMFIGTKIVRRIIIPITLLVTVDDDDASRSSVEQPVDERTEKGIVRVGNTILKSTAFQMHD